MSEINANIQVTPISATFTVTQPTTTFTANATQLNIFAGTSPTAGGSNTNVQYNLLGKLAGSNGFSYNGITNTATLQNLLISNVANLGGTSNVKISGGLNNYVLATDGTGNLTWTSKGSQIINIQALSNANPIIMTVANTTPYVNGTPVTISNVAGPNANTIVNSQTFYVKVSNNYSSSGNVGLYTDSGLTTGANGFYLAAVANTGTAMNYFNTTGSNTAAGTNTQVQFNDAGTFGGNAGFTFDKITGNLNTPNNFTAVGNITGNVYFGNGSQLTGVIGNSNYAAYAGNVVDAYQANITSVGNLISLNVDTNANIGGNANANNLRSFNDVYCVGNLFAGNANLGNLTISNFFQGNGSLLSSVTATTAGTVTTNAQPNITSVGTLTVLNVAGNLTTTGTTKLQQSLEKITLYATANTGVINFDMLTQAIIYNTANSSANIGLNVRGNSTTTANSVIGVGNSTVVTYVLTNGPTAYNIANISIDGTAQAIKWAGNTIPNTFVSTTMSYTFNIIKLDTTPTYSVFASATRFG
jgi:hypothetical protein